MPLLKPEPSNSGFFIEITLLICQLTHKEAELIEEIIMYSSLVCHAGTFRSSEHIIFARSSQILSPTTLFFVENNPISSSRTARYSKTRIP